MMQNMQMMHDTMHQNYKQGRGYERESGKSGGRDQNKKQKQTQGQNKKPKDRLEVTTAPPMEIVRMLEVIVVNQDLIIPRQLPSTT